jgi:hypothetical protein
MMALRRPPDCTSLLPRIGQMEGSGIHYLLLKPIELPIYPGALDVESSNLQYLSRLSGPQPEFVVSGAHAVYMMIVISTSSHCGSNNRCSSCCSRILGPGSIGTVTSLSVSYCWV